MSLLVTKNCATEKGATEKVFLTLDNVYTYCVLRYVRKAQ